MRRRVVAGIVALALALACGGLVLGRALDSPSLHVFSVGRHSVAVAVDATRERAYVVDRVSSGVSILDLRSGATLREAQVATGAYNATIDERDGRVLVWSDGHSVIDDGVSLGAEPGNTPAGGLNAVTILDSGGATLRTVALDTVLQAVAVDESAGLALLGVGDPDIPPPASRGIVALDAVNGRTRYVVRTAQPAVAVAVDAPAGRAIAYLEDSTILTLDVRSGAVLAHSRLRANCRSGMAPPQIAVDERSGRAFVFDGNTTCLTVIDVRSGDVLHSGRTALQPLAMAVDEAANRVLVLDDQGAEAMLDGSTGALLRRRALGIDNVSLLAGTRGTNRVYAIYDGANLAVLDGASGVLLRTIALGGDVTAMGVDHARGHLVVAMAAGAAARSDTLGWLPSWLRHMLPGGGPPNVSLGRGTVREIAPG